MGSALLGFGGKRVQLLQCMISFATGISEGIGGGTISKSGITGVIGGIPVIIPTPGSKSKRKGEDKKEHVMLLALPQQGPSGGPPTVPTDLWGQEGSAGRSPVALAWC